MIADLDTLLTALYVELTDRIIASLGLARSGPGQRPEVTDAELACLAVAQVLLRYDDERHWLRAARQRVGHLFPRLLGQSEYNARLKNAAPLMEAALRWLAGRTPATAEMLRLMDATPIPCGQSVITARRSGLFGWAGYGYCPSHSRWYWGSKLLLICTCDGTVTGFSLANPKLAGEREQARTMLERAPANRPAPGTAIVTDKGLSGEGTEEFFASPGLDLELIRPARKDEKAPRYFPNWPFTGASQHADGHVGQRRHRLGPRGPGQHGGGHRLPQLPPGQQLGVDRRDLRQHRLGLLSPAQVAAYHPGQRGWHVPAPAPAGRARGEVGIRAVRLAVLAPAAGPAAPARLLGQRAGEHLLHVAEPGGGRAAAGQQLPGGQPPEIVLVCIHHTRECRERDFRSTTAKGTGKRVEFGQPRGRQPTAQRRLTPVGPCLRQRDLPADTARADEHRARPPAPDIQDLQPLAGQRWNG